MSIRSIRLTVGNTVKGYAKTFAYKYGRSLRFKIPTYTLTLDGKLSDGTAFTKQYEVIRFGVQQKTPTSSPRVVGFAEQQVHVIKAWLPSYTVHSYASTEIGAWQVYKNWLIHDGPDLPHSQVYASIGCVEVCNGPLGFDIFNDDIITLSGSTAATRAQKLNEIGSSGSMSITYLKAARPALIPW